MEKEVKKVVVDSIVLPIAEADAIFNYLNGINRPFTEKEYFMNVLRNAVRVAEYAKRMEMESKKEELPDKCIDENL